MRKKFLPRVLWSVAFSLSSSGQYLVFDSSDLSIETMELFCIYVLHCFWIDVVVQICPKCLCIYGFVNKFWTGRIFERLQKVCGGSNLSTVLLLRGIYIKKCISLVRICLQTRNDAQSAEMHLQNFEKLQSRKVFVICRLRQRDIVASDSDIAPLRSAVILYSPPKARNAHIVSARISLGVSRISLRSNRTRRKANITEKSTLARAFFLAGMARFELTNARVKV